eukprot:jgi/Tetstr1/465268/TSEL_009970.t1
MYDIDERLLSLIVWLDSPQLSGLTGDEITQHMAGILLESYEAAGLGVVEPLELEETLLRDAASRGWDFYGDVDNHAPNAGVRLPPVGLMELPEVKHISRDHALRPPEWSSPSRMQHSMRWTQ